MSTAPLRAAVEVALEDATDVYLAPVCDRLTEVALTAVPDGWAKKDGRWWRLVSEGAGASYRLQREEES